MLGFPPAVYAPNLNLTIEAWVYREDAARCETILSQDYTRLFWLGFCGGKVRFYRSGQQYADADRGVPARRWTHVAASYSAEGVQELVVRCWDGTGEVDTLARIVAHNVGGGPNNQLFVGVHGFQTANAAMPGAHLALAWGPRPLERTVPGASDYRITGFYNDGSLQREQGDGAGGFAGRPSLGDAAARFAFCDGEFQPARLEFGTSYVGRDTGAGLMLYLWQTNRVFVPPAGWQTLFEYAYPSPFDTRPNDPSTWARVTFGSRVGTVGAVVADVRVVETFAAEGLEVPRANVPVYLTYASGTLRAEALTDSDGRASLSALVAINIPLRVSIAPPALWLVRGVDVVPGTGISPVTTTQTEAFFPGCGEGRCDLSDLVFRVVAVPERGMSVTGVSPDTVWPRVVVRESPLKTVGPGQIEIRGMNLHNALRVWLTSCDTLPPPPGSSDPQETTLCDESQFHRLTEVQTSADGRRLVATVDAPERWFGSSRRVLVQDPVSRPGQVPWAFAPGSVFISHPPYPQVWGFEFRNERDGTQFDEFSNVYQWRAYDCVLAFPPGWSFRRWRPALAAGFPIRFV